MFEAPEVDTSLSPPKVVGIVGLFKISASPLLAVQSDCTLTSAPEAMPFSLFFSAVVKFSSVPVEVI